MYEHSTSARLVTTVIITELLWRQDDSALWRAGGGASRRILPGALSTLLEFQSVAGRDLCNSAQRFLLGKPGTVHQSSGTVREGIDSHSIFTWPVDLCYYISVFCLSPFVLLVDTCLHSQCIQEKEQTKVCVMQVLQKLQFEPRKNEVDWKNVIAPLGAGVHLVLQVILV